MMLFPCLSLVSITGDAVVGVDVNGVIEVGPPKTDSVPVMEGSDVEVDEGPTVPSFFENIVIVSFCPYLGALYVN